MKWKLLWFVGVTICVLFYVAVALAYFVPQIAAYRAAGWTMLVFGLVVVAPTFIGLLTHLSRQGLRSSGNNARSISGSK